MSNGRLRIGIQGVRASFHDVAARKFFADREIAPVECASFRRLGEALAAKEADYCMMAVENSIAGSILPNYSLLESRGFKVIGETYLRIEMCLLALPGAKLADIHTVQSHPMAILQCDEFLARLPNARVLEAADTAESAKQIVERKLAGTAAIASRLAGETYGLEILSAGIETNRENYTRFLAICRAEDYRPAQGANKASVRFETAHRPGSLADVLEILKRHQVNMTKIQSVPILGKPYQYSFHLDIDWEDSAQYASAMTEFKAHAINLIHFGEYPRGERPGA